MNREITIVDTTVSIDGEVHVEEIEKENIRNTKISRCGFRNSEKIQKQILCWYFWGR